MLWVCIEEDDFFEVPSEVAEVLDVLLLVVPAAVLEELVEDVDAVRIQLFDDRDRSVGWLSSKENDLVEL